jgi:GH25 family lysozyme M1 (1,4-beta-N-acetylmuramidase)
MASHTHRPWRRLLGIAATTALSTALLTAFSPTAAAEEDEKDSLVRAKDTPMGSQIAEVEGIADQVRPGGQASSRGSSPTSGVQGIDVSGWQKNVDWDHWWNQGKRFAYVKATEGTGYKNPYFTQQYNGSYNRGFIRGAYHFALPDRSGGKAQADYFASNGGGWSPDGKTLPGVVDLEWNPYGSACYGKTKSQMKSWIKSFHDTYRARTGRWPVIYTSTSWWNQCVGGGHGFEQTVPLWIARYSSSVGDLPPGWNYWTFWQYSDNPIDQNKFNGTMTRLRALATNPD